MNREPLRERGSLPVIDAGPAGDLRLATGTFAGTTAPRTEWQQLVGLSTGRATAATCRGSAAEASVSPSPPDSTTFRCHDVF
jgi:hypothetical protein